MIVIHKVDSLSGNEKTVLLVQMCGIITGSGKQASK